MDISGVLQSQESVNLAYNPSPDVEFQKKNRDQWRKVLGTFDLIKNNRSINKTNRRKKTSIQRKQIVKRTKEETFPPKNSPERSILSSSFTNTVNQSNYTQPNLDESEIIWSSSNEESDNYLNIENLNQKNKVSGCKKNLKRIHYETEINWSSSESESEGSLTKKSRLCAFPKQIDAEYELTLFVREIEKDLRRTKKINEKLTTKTGGYRESFQKAMHKAKADTCFLDYEQKAEIIFGFKGFITEKKVSYGSCFSNVQLETGSNHYVFLGKNIQTNNKERTVVCFLDDSHFYTVNGRNVYIQPNKVIRA